MTEATWEKSPELAEQLKTRKTQRWIYMTAGVALIGVVVFLVLKGTLLGSSYFKTVDDLVNDPSLIGKKVRVSGAVAQVNGVNDIHIDDKGTLTFTIIHIPNDNGEIRRGGGLGKVLVNAVSSPELARLTVVYNGDIPDLMRGTEPTQAIVEGKLGEDGIFYATSLQTKCPTKYADDVPEQVARN
jgi:cytochrome c-type biogenesis protein CcmE